MDIDKDESITQLRKMDVDMAARAERYFSRTPLTDKVLSGEFAAMIVQEIPWAPRVKVKLSRSRKIKAWLRRSFVREVGDYYSHFTFLKLWRFHFLISSSD